MISGITQVSKNKSSDFNVGLGLLKILAIFGIVGCHLNLRPTTSTGEWLLHFTDTNVGLFGITSGYFLAKSLCQATEWSVFLKKKSARLLPAYFFWTICYLLLKFGLDLFFKGGMTSAFKDPMHWYYIIFWGGGAAHLWYVISLLYISLGLLALRNYLHAAWPILMILAFFGTMHGWGGFFSWYPIRLLAFVCLGVGLFFHDGMLKRVTMPVWGAVFLIALLAHLFLPWRGWISVYDALVCVPLFMIFRNLPLGRYSSSQLLRRLTNCSFGIYLSHVFIAYAIGNFVRSIFFAPYSAWILVLDWSLVFIVALFLTYILRSLPATRRFVD